ncbi:hypothetical protein G5714_000068 [Onychostoma macrolepis]|uniref:Fibrinogen C-terminal domain-containing protein n=1 Tax=Onychostoma macrolepis TaxID=369639 RepID=A0A7J6DFG5_9TELE|nr:hypothetical protein G5714_000068 [Onychostoma macrolepis]
MTILFLVALLPVVLGSDCKFMQFDCSDIYNSGETVSGIYSIYPTGDVPVWVYCQMISDGNDEDKGGWTVIQRRMDGSVNFYQPWNQYKRGFGNVESEYWLGKISQAGEHVPADTQQEVHLRVDLEDFEGRKGFALYSYFSVDCECAGYKIYVSGFTDGGAGDSLTSHNNQKFSTFDKDQDVYEDNCARMRLGAFWYAKCLTTNPNANQRLANGYDVLPASG